METVAQFLARGGKIKAEPIRPCKPKKLPRGEALRKRIRKEAASDMAQ